MSIPTREQVDEYITSVEEYVVSSFAFISDVQAINDSVQRLWMHVSRFGPPELPDLHFPSLGNYPVPPPPPPPPPQPTHWYDNIVSWASKNRYLIGAVCVGAVGAGLLAGYGTSAYAGSRIRAKRVQRAVGSSPTMRRLLVVVLGGDTPLGLPLVTGLEKEGYIVITTVSNPDSVTEVEAAGNGYVRALVFDPRESSTLQPFLRSLKATLSLRFPINSPGDPYSHSPTAIPVLYSIICLLTLPPATSPPTPTPFEHLELATVYNQYLMQTHIVPLQVIQALLPLFRVDSIRTHDATQIAGGRKSIIICLPASDARVGVPYGSMPAMSASATVRGVEVLRRELHQSSDLQMREVRVVIMDLGTIGDVNSSMSRAHSIDENSLTNNISQWTPSEQKAYASPYFAYISALLHGCGRKPTSVSRFVRAMVAKVGQNASRKECRSSFVLGLKLCAAGVYSWVRSDRFSVGSGAGTYALASCLPTSVLDTLLNLPALLAPGRNTSIPVPPRITPSPANDRSALPREKTASMESTAPVTSRDEENAAPPSIPSLSPRSSNHGSGVISETKEDANVENSWVSVQD